MREKLKITSNTPKNESGLIQLIMMGESICQIWINCSVCNVLFLRKMSRLMRKPTICICENKDADQLRGNREDDQRLFFATRIVHFLFFLNPEFQASSLLLCLYSSVSVGPVRKPHCLFSHKAAQLSQLLLITGPVLVCCIHVYCRNHVTALANKRFTPMCTYSLS